MDRNTEPAMKDAGQDIVLDARIAKPDPQLVWTAVILDSQRASPAPTSLTNVYNTQYYGCMHAWKIETFNDLAWKMDSIRRNVITGIY